MIASTKRLPISLGDKSVVWNAQLKKLEIVPASKTLLDSIMPQTKERRTNTKINVSSSNSSIVSVCSLTSRDSQTSIKSFFSVSSCRTNLRRPKKSTLLNQQTIDKDDTTGNHNEIIAAVSDKNKQGANTGNNALSFQDRRQPCKIKEELRVSVKLDTQKRIKTYEQLYIDLGQRNFAAQIICPICGMLTVHGLEADIQRHKAVCQAHTQGVSFPHALFRGTLPLLRVHSTFALPYYNPPTGKIMVTEVSTKSRKRRLLMSDNPKAHIIEVRHKWYTNLFCFSGYWLSGSVTLTAS